MSASYAWCTKLTFTERNLNFKTNKSFTSITQGEYYNYKNFKQFAISFLAHKARTKGLKE